MILSQNYFRFCISAFLLISLYYLSYRYPFQINSSLTSPTYSDTPTLLSLGKYLLTLCLYVTLAIGLFLSRSQLCREDYSILGMLLSALSFGSPLLGALLTATSGDTYFFEVLFFAPIFGFTYLSLKPFGSYFSPYIYRLLATAAWSFLIFDIVQVLLFATHGRLPALAFENSISIRFGSFLDDPNGYAFLLALFTPLAIAMQRVRKALFIALAGVNLFLTFSLTGIISFVAAGLFLLLVHSHFKRTVNLLALTALLLTPVLIISAAALIGSSIFSTFMEAKSESISQHLSIFDKFGDIDSTSLFGFNPTGALGESGILNIAANFGVFSVLLLYFIGASTITTSIDSIQKLYIGPNMDSSQRQLIAVNMALLGFVVATLVGLSNLPLESVFPINALFPFCLALLLILPTSICTSGSLRG
jgi:hypothetical protein